MNSRVLLELRGLSAAVRMSRFFRRVTVETSAVCFVPDGKAAKAANAVMNVESAPTIRHTEPTIVLAYGRCLPPWLNTGMILTDSAALGTDAAVVQMSGAKRRRIVTAMRAAGFDCAVYRTSFSMGGQVGSRSELERFRQSHTATTR